MDSQETKNRIQEVLRSVVTTINNFNDEIRQLKKENERLRSLLFSTKEDKTLQVSSYYHDKLKDIYDLIIRKIKTPWYTEEEIAIYNEVLNILKPIIQEQNKKEK